MSKRSRRIKRQQRRKTTSKVYWPAYRATFAVKRLTGSGPAIAHYHARHAGRRAVKSIKK